MGVFSSLGFTEYIKHLHFKEKRLIADVYLMMLTKNFGCYTWHMSEDSRNLSSGNWTQIIE